MVTPSEYRSNESTSGINAGGVGDTERGDEGSDDITIICAILFIRNSHRLHIMTVTGFEPVRGNPSRFQIYPNNHSGTLPKKSSPGNRTRISGFKVQRDCRYTREPYVMMTGFEPARAKAQYLSKVPR